MKKVVMLAILFMVTCAFICPDNALAIGPKLGFGVEIALPQGDFGDGAGTGFGASARLEKGNIVPGLGFTLTAGFIQFGEKEILNTKFKTSLIPIQAGVKYSIPVAGVYGILEAGVHIAKFEAEIIDGDLLDGDSDESETKFSFAPGIGYTKPLGPSLKLDLSVRYQIIKTDVEDSNYIGFRIGMVLGLL